MIISLRGTNGTGKTHLVREVMSGYATRSAYRLRQGRRQPIGYVLRSPGLSPLAVPGQYETVCGGCDTINTLDEVFELVESCHRAGWHVLFEGMLESGEYKRTLSLHQRGLPVEVVWMHMEVEGCVRRVEQRRAERGETKPLNPKNLYAKHDRTEKVVKRLMAAGVPTRRFEEYQPALEGVQALLARPWSES